MKIVLVTETFPPEVNGVAMTNQRLVRGLVAKGHEIILVKPGKKREAAEAKDGWQVFPVLGSRSPIIRGCASGCRDRAD